MRVPAVSVLVAGVLGLVFVAASAPPRDQRRTLDRQCVFNDECAPGLICAGDFCRAQCRTARDCARGDVCQTFVIDSEERILRRPSATEAVASNTHALLAEPGHFVRPRCVPEGFVPPVIRAPAGAVPSATGAGPSIEWDVDRPGSDYKSFETADGPDLCATSCAGDARCRAWVWMKPAQQGKSAVCWLKDAVPAGRRDPCCAAGVKR